MRLITLFFVLSFLFFAAYAKAVKKIVKLSSFSKQGPFIFLTKFRIGPGHGQMDISYTKGGEIPSEAFYNDVSIGMVSEKVYDQFKAANICQAKMKLLHKRQKFNLRQERQGMKHVKIFDLQQEQIWYFYLFSCVSNLEQLNSSSEEINLTFSTLNNGSHFGQGSYILYAYIVVVIVWVLLIVKFAVPMGTLLTFKNPDGLKLLIFGGLVLLGAAYFYRLIHLILYYQDGLGIHYFQIFYLVLKNVGEAIITTVIISISWGWSIIHLKSSKSYLIIGVLAGIINIVSLILAALTEQHEDVHHHFETTPGLIVLGLRVILFLVFITGIFLCLKQSSGKIIHFIRKFAVVGGAYLLCWPITVLLIELLLPNFMHREVITLIEETVHIYACTVICSMISEPESAYRRVSLQEDDNPLRIKNYHKK